MTASVKQEGGMIKDGCYETKSVGMYAKLKKSMMMMPEICRDGTTAM